MQGLLFWLFKGVSINSSGTVQWYTSSYGTSVGLSEIGSPLLLVSGSLTVLDVGLYLGK